MSPSKFLFVLGLIFLQRGIGARFVIRKCCPDDQHFDEEIDCVPNMISGTDLVAFNQTYGGTWPWWFPKTSKLRRKDANDVFLNAFPNDSLVMAGVAEPCSDSTSAFLPTYGYDFDFYDDGSIMLYKNSLQRKNVIYPPNSYCVDRIHGESFNETGEEYIVKLCPCDKTVCMYKCCHFGMFLNVIPSDSDHSTGCKMGTQDNGTTSECEIADTPSKKMPLDSSELCAEVPANVTDEWEPNGVEDYFVLYGFPHCEIGDESVVTQLHSRQKYQFRNDGTLWLDALGTAGKLKYCADFGGYSQEKVSTYVLRCYARSERLRFQKLQRILYGSLALIGAFFLLLTVITYSMLNRELTVNDRNLLAQTWSLLIGYLAIGIFRFFQNDMPHSFCVFLGFVILYAFLASFFWLNVLCIDLAWAFSELRLIRNMKVWQNRRRFLQYSIYAWLSPAVIVLATIIIDFTPGVPDYILKPEFVTKCFFPNDSMAKFAYFYGPMAVLLLTNVLLFLFTAFKIRSAQRQASTLLQSHHRQERQRVILYLKLFSLMGLSWVFELISWAVGGPDYYWYGTDIVNLFRAVFIFVTLCCKKQVLEELREKFKIAVPRGRQTASNSVVTLASNLGAEPSQNRFSHLASSAL